MRLGPSVGVATPVVAALAGFAAQASTSSPLPRSASALGLLLFAVVSIAAYMDARFRRIPNWLTYPAFVVGLTLIVGANAFGWDWVGAYSIGQHLGGFALGFATVLIVFAASGFGAGDVKLVAVVGLCVGFPRILECLLWTYGLAAALSIAFVVMRFGPKAAVVGAVATDDKLGPAGNVRRMRIPMAPFFLLGCTVEALRNQWP